MGEKFLWWQKGVIYQIYPRSFQDSNNDGIGDINGIISRLDYLKYLGIDAIWLSPINKSPMKDFGYDISDYKQVDPIFGNIDDFIRLINEAHKINIKIIMDLVVNHTSNEHPWFIESRSSKNNSKKDWYIWHPGKNKKPPNNWFSAFELKSAWWWDEIREEFYLGTFTRYQPELNWRNPDVRNEIYNIIKYWLDLGVDGFRMDVVNWYIKDEYYRNNPWKIQFNPPDLQIHIYDRNRPETHEICKEIRKLVDQYQEKMLVGEIYINNVTEAAKYYGENLDELHMAFNFAFLFEKWGAKNFYKRIIEWNNVIPKGGWPNYTLSNHDQPRHYSRYKKGKWTDARAKVSATLLLTIKGTPFIYYGEEIGMENTKIPRKLIKDPLGINLWPIIKGRDPQRTPMQWDNSDNAGFSKSITTWLPINKNYKIKNVQNQLNDPNSLLNFYKNLIQLRKTYNSLSCGEIEFIIKGENDILFYKRFYENEIIYILLNFSSKKRIIKNFNSEYFKVIFGNYRKANEIINLNTIFINPYEILVFQNY